MLFYKNKKKNLSPIRQELEKLYAMVSEDKWAITIHIEPQEVADAQLWCDQHNLTMKMSHVTEGKIYYKIFQ